MQTKTATIVVTTIFDPCLLDGYRDNLEHWGRLDDVEVIVIPDKNTPHSAYRRCQDLADKGLKIQCPTIEEQEAFLTAVGINPQLIPYNSDNRRNVGYLMAYRSGRDFLISIDDDNHCRPDEDFVGEHSIVCSSHAHEAVESATGYLNICNLLQFEKPAPIYPRGFPYAFRHLEETPCPADKSVAIAINAGLWTHDPDIDGITWLVTKPRVLSFKGRSVVLGPKTWSPVNSQNTALRRDAIPAYYFIRMGYPISGMPIDRYGDIFSGYFAQVCAKHLGHTVRVGTPVAEHRRNSHNYMRDATNEWACILALEELLPWLIEFRPEGNSYHETFGALSFGIQEAVERFQGRLWTDVTRGYFHQMAHYMRSWLAACHAICPGPF